VGAQLIEASAGTGKTYTIGTLVLRLLLESPGRPGADSDRAFRAGAVPASDSALTIDQILVVTFTNAASAELRGRIRERLVDALAQVEGGPASGDDRFAGWLDARAAQEPEACRNRLRAALRDFDDAAIFTIHGFCQRILQEHAFESGVDFDLELVGDETDLRLTAIHDFWANRCYAAPALAVAWLQGPGKLGLDRLEALGKGLAAAPHPRRVPAPTDEERVAAHTAELAATGTAAAPAPDDDASALSELEASYEAAWSAAADAWQAGGREALDLLAQAASEKRLNGGTYKPDKILGPWSKQLVAAFAAAPNWPDEDFRKVLGNLAAGRMRVNKNKQEPEHPFFEACAELVEALEGIAEDLADWSHSLRHGLDAWLRRELPERKRRAAQQSFDDLLYQVHAALEPGSDQARRLVARIRGRYRAALIDEFQDTDLFQYEIFKRIFEPGPDSSAAVPLLLVGDPKQAIYSFRGADIFAYLKAVEDVGDAGRHTLSKNYRSDRSLVEAVNLLWSAVPRPFLFEKIDYLPVEAHFDDRVAPPEPPLRFAYIPAEVADRSSEGKPVKAAASRRAAARAAATAIGRLLGEAPKIEGSDGGLIATSAEDIAVLVRTNKQAQQMQRVLRAHGIPSVLHGEASVLDQPEAGELRQILAAILDPSRARKVRAALVTPAFGLDAVAIDALALDEKGWEDWIASFRQWQEVWRSAGFLPALRRLIDQNSVAERLLQLGDGERRLTNLLHLAELLHSVAFQLDFGPEGLLAWFDRAREDDELRRSVLGDTGQLRLESDEAAVKIVTVHKAKGLEYPFVFCPFLWSGSKFAASTPLRFHDLDGEREQLLDIGAELGEASKRAHELEELAEDLRLLYVAMTRARHGLWLALGPLYKFESSALAYLLHAGALAKPESGDHSSLLAAWNAAVLSSAKGAVLAAAKATEPAGDPLWQAVERLAASQAQRISASRLTTGDLQARAQRAENLDAATGGPSEARVARRKPQQLLYRSSFTALARGAVDTAAVDASDGLDRDGLAPEGLAGEAPASRSQSSASPESESSEPVPLADMVAGAHLGTGLHALLENIDFGGDALSWQRQAQTLNRRRILPDEAVEPLLDALDTILHTKLGRAEMDFCLAGLGRRDRIDEMGYVLPVALKSEDGRILPWQATGRGTAKGSATATADGAIAGELATDASAFQRVGPAAIARVFSAHPGGALPADYSRRLAALPAPALAGWLRGSLDLVFRREQPEGGPRWYLADWKSNRLGRNWADYAADRLSAAMAHHHYFLQAHLYAVALHRYLSRFEDYDYDTNFGGYLYVFVRGMRQDRPGSGILFDRPPRARIEALDALLREGRTP
jgi:exodeoxyribonuclease V beta subunit